MSFEMTLHVEQLIKEPEHPTWHHYNRPTVPQDYEMFNLIGFGDPDKDVCQFPLKGWPIYCSVPTVFDYEHHPENNFKPSWLSSDEVYQLIVLMTQLNIVNSVNSHKYFGWFYGNYFESFKTHENDFKTLKKNGLQDFRFVFWWN